jgi:uncharacterized OB-fold protein
MNGVVYTETVVHSAPEALSAEAPYQLVIVEMTGDEPGKAPTGAKLQRRTGRMRGERVVIGDRVTLVEEKDGVPFYQKA